MKSVESLICPKCGKAMIYRPNGKFGPFYGCSGFPNCRTIIDVKKAAQMMNDDPKALRRIKNLSIYQQAFENFIKSGKGHGIGKATAGSGKTRTQEHLIAILIEDMKVPASDIIYLAFNAHVVKEAQEKGLPAISTHTAGKRMIEAYNGKIKTIVDNNKINDIVKKLLQNTWDDEKWMISPISQIVSKLKNTMAPWDNESQGRICDKFGVEVNGSSERIFELVRTTMEESNKQLTKIDFDDMLYLPVKFKMISPKYKFVLGDEVQDWNLCQILLVQKMVADDGRFLGVGDENQSMYTFRGAAPDAMKRLQAAFQAQELPLSISYRNPKSHVRFINQLFPDIKHEMWENAIEGEILSMSQDKMLGNLKDGDLVICRNNAPLVEPVFALIRQGIKAIIRGRDIGDNLINLCERFKTQKTDDLLAKLEDYRIREIAKLLKAEKNNQAQLLDDKVQTIFVLAEGTNYTYQVIQKISEVFSDKNEGVVFSSIHKAKGDEAERVFILQPQLMPSKYAKDEEALAEEKHIMFVALSRSKHTMVFVGGPAPIAFESQEMWEKDELEETEAKVIKQLTEYLPEGTKLFTDVKIYEDGSVTSEKEIIINRIPKCPF